MESLIAKALELEHEPVAVLFTKERPSGAARFKARRWGCVMDMLSFAARGYTAVFDRETVACAGGRAGLCFGGYRKPSEVARFLAKDKAGEGLAFVKSSALARRFVQDLPTVDIAEPYVVFTALSRVDPKKDKPKVVVFLADADRVSALLTLANYDRPGGDAVWAPFASGCQAVCLLPYAESRRRKPRAVLGGTDLSARVHLPKGVLTFAAPYAMFLKMEKNVPGSFLEREVWLSLRDR
jgi:uncharacterized protein (DUF169 family)